MNLEKARKWTIIFIAVVIIAIAVYDVFIIAEAGTEASISHILIEWSYKFPAFTFLMGFTMGHLFWRMGDTAKTKTLGK